MKYISRKGVKCWEAKPGYAFNPLNRINGNLKCTCGSNLKIKKCCGMIRYIPEEKAEVISEFLNGLTPEEKAAVGIK
jgi:hypothetical protein